MSFADFKLIGINRFPTSLYMWGDNTNGLLGDNRTPSYFSWSKISSGGLHTVAIRSDGTLFAWGRNTEFQLGDTTTIHRSSPVQIGTSSWSQVSAGTSHTVAINGDSTLWSWGANRYGQLGLGDTANRSSPVQVGTSSWSVIAAGGNHSLGIKIDNSVFAWGYNGSGQLGDLSIVSRNSPVQVGTSALGDANAYSVNVSGNNRYLEVANTTALQFGTGDFTMECWVLIPGVISQIGYATNIIGNQISNTENLGFIIYTGKFCALKYSARFIVGTTTVQSNTWYHIAIVRSGATMTLYVNGVSEGSVSNSIDFNSADNFRVGYQSDPSINQYISNVRLVKGIAVYTGTFAVPTTPLSSTQSSDTNISAITGNSTSLLTAQNTTFIDNSSYTHAITNVGGVSFAYSTPFTSTIPVGAITATSISAGKSHSTAITTNNQLYSWGDNTYGELGDSTTINRSSPVQIGTSSWSQVSAGGTHTVGIESDGSLLAWGYNNYGQLGLNTPYSGIYYTQVSEGPTHTLAIRNDGALFVWGRNDLGQLGTSDTVDRSSPVQIGTSSWTSVNAGSSHSTAIRSDNKLFTWGANDYGQLGNNLDVTTIATNITWSKIVMDSSGVHSLAIKNDGTLWGWGLNTSGQLGDGTAASKSSPVQVGALNTWIDVAAGSVHSLGITNDNVLYTWGTNTFGQLGDNTNNAKSSPIVVGFNYKKVFAGYQTSIAIDNNNLAYIWGDNANGLIPGGVVGTHRSSIALLNTETTWNSFAINQHILGIKTDGSLWSWGLGTTGQLGLNDLLSRSSPTQIGTSSWSMVSAGLSYSMGITSDNSLYAWGLNSSGQLGLSDTVNRSAPATVGLAEGLTDDNAYSTFFNGSATFLTIPKEAITMSSSGSTTNPTYTVECWYNRTGGGYHSILATSGSTSPTFNFMVDNTRRISLNVAGTNTDGPTLLSFNRWYHIALTRNPTGVSNNAVFNVYLNGVLEFTMNDGDPMRNVEPYCIANDFTHGASQYLAGYLSNYRISNKIVYTGNFTVPVSPLELTQLSDTNISSLTAGEVKFLSLQTSTTSPVDISTNAYTITVTGTITSSQLTPFTDAIATGSTIATNVVAGTAHTLMLDSVGNLYTWGLGTSGQLGDAAVLSRSSPVQVGTDLYNNIFATTSHSTAIRSTDSVLFTWGLGTSGQLGDITALSKSSPVQIGTTLSNQSSPVQIGNSSYSQVSAGAGHTLGLGYDGILYGWGKNDQGQIGGQLNTLGIGWSKVVVGPTHSLGIRFDGTLYAWGNNASGQLGDRTIVAKSSPVVIDSANNWKDIAVGQGTLYYSMAIRNDGKLFAWGNNQGGQLGWISWRQLSVGSGHSLLLRSDGALYTMGTNTAGQLGDATTVNRSSPVLIGTSSWNFVNAGVSASAAIDSRGRLFTWGFNNVGQLGLANTTSRSSPVQVSTGSWSQVASEDYMLAITSQGSIWSWGNNNNGQLGLGTTVNSKVPKLLDGTTTSYSIGFDGVNDYLTIPANTAFVFGTGNFTIECWFYRTEGPNGTIFDTRSVTPSITPVLYFNSSILKYKVSDVDRITSTTTLSFGVWYHVALVRSSGSSKMYLNGVQTGSTYADTNNFTLNNTINIGRGFDSSWYLTGGYLSNLRVVKGQALYTNRFIPSTSPLTTTSQGINTGTVSLLTAQSAAIIDTSGNGFTITAIGTPTVTQYNPFSVISSTSSTSWTNVAAGTHSLAIKSDSTLYAWGLNSTGQLGDSTTINKSSPIQISTSSWSFIGASMTGHSLGIQVDGALFAWGRNTYGELGVNNEFFDVSSPVQIMSPLSFTAVSAGNNASLAMATENNINTLYGWGLNNENQLNNVSPFVWLGLNEGTGVYANVGSTVGKLYLWGDNTYGQLGDNTVVARSSPTQLGGFLGANTYKYIVNNPLNTAYINVDNTLYMMGDNTYGQLGQGDTINRSSPVQIGTGTWSTVVISGSGHVLAISSNGTLFTWGNNTYNELGQSDLVVANRSSPVTIGTDANWTKISVGNNYSIAVNNTGAMYTWGRNDWGQLGTIVPLSYTNIGAGIASRNDGKLYTWGTNTPYGQVGDGTTINRSAPTQISGVTLASISWTSVSGSLNNSASIRINSTLWAWGDNTYGQLGQVDTIPRSNPVQIGISSWTQVHVNSDNIFAIRSDGKLFSWGNNNVGQLGTGDTINYSSPVQIGSDSWNQIVASTTGHALGIKTDGTLWAWGNNQYNELGLNEPTQTNYSSPVQIGTSSWTKVSAGSNNSFAIRDGGSLFGWGRNQYGQIGDATTNNRSSPVQIGNSSWTQVAAGDSFVAAINAIGQLFTWGYGINGRLGSGATASRSSPVQVGTSSWIAISTGGTENTVALTIAYTLFSWGINNTGQVGDATTVIKSAPAAVGAALNTNLMTDVIKTVTQVGTSSWTQISAGDFHAYAIRTGGGLFAWGKNDQGQLGLSIAITAHRSSPVQVGASTYNVISAGNSFGAAITSISTLFTTGLNNNGQQGAGTTVRRSAFTLVGTSSWTAVNAGATSMIGTSISNITFVWGTNTAGQLGLGDTANRSAPTQLGSNLAGSMYQTVYPSPVTVSTFTTASWTQVNVGDSFSVGIDNSGRLYSWGRNNTGQLGNGTTINTMPTKSSPTQIATTASSFTFINTSSPVQVSTGTSWNSVVAGGTHTVAIKSDGTLWAWGLNTFGQVGTISTLNQYVPKQIDILNSFTNLAAGSDFSVALKDDKTLWRWGFNTSTDISSPHRSNPLQLGSDSWNVISAAGNTAVAINSDGKLYGWGKITTDDNFFFNLPVDPITWAVNKSYTNVNAGDSFIHAIDSSNELWGYGLNNIGQLGDSTTVTRSSPVQIGSVYNWSIIGGGIGATPMHAGALYLTGLNSSGQLGLGDVAFRSSPVQLPATNQPLFNFPVRIGISRWSQISAGYSHSMAIRDDNTLWGWGLNASGQVGDTSVVSRSSPVQIGTSSWIAISAGASHTSAIKLGDTLWSWGLNTRGQLGDSTTVNRNSPVQIGTGYWNNVTAGASHTTALADNNTLYIWGDDNFGQ